MRTPKTKDQTRVERRTGVLMPIVPNTESEQTPSAAAEKIAHTPGPWTIDECRDANGFVTIRPHDGTKNGDVHASPIATVYYDEVEANARLIAAAPELLEALESTRDLLIAYKRDFPNHFADLDARFGADAVIQKGYAALQKAGAPNAQKGGAL